MLLQFWSFSELILLKFLGEGSLIRGDLILVNSGSCKEGIQKDPAN